LGPSTPDYVREVMTSAHRCADGVHVYCHQKPDSEKYPIIKELFNDWAKDAPSEPAKPQ
jgi:histone acetyltransferase (RNA polymerase elongator complex component)